MRPSPLDTQARCLKYILLAFHQMEPVSSLEEMHNSIGRLIELQQTNPYLPILQELCQEKLELQPV